MFRVFFVAVGISKSAVCCELWAPCSNLTKGWIMVPRQRNARGFTDPLRPPQGPDVCLPKIVSSRRSDAAARAVMVRSLKPDSEPKQVYNCVEASAWSLRCVHHVEP